MITLGSISSTIILYPSVQGLTPDTTPMVGDRGIG